MLGEVNLTSRPKLSNLKDWLLDFVWERAYRYPQSLVLLFIDDS